jgi:hypothetical protein
MSADNGYVVVLSRMDDDYEQVLIGPFRTKERADERAAVIRKLAHTYDDPEGTGGTGENILDVVVEPLRVGTISAQGALDYLYGGP